MCLHDLIYLVHFFDVLYVLYDLFYMMHFLWWVYIIYFILCTVFFDGFTRYILFGAFFRWVYMIYFIWCIYSMCLHDLFYLMHFFDGFTWFIWHDAFSSMGLHDIFYLMHFFDGFTWFILFKFMHLVDGFKFPALLLRWFYMLVRVFSNILNHLDRHQPNKYFRSFLGRPPHHY